MDKTILNEFLKRPIAYQPIVAKAIGSVKLGILWSQFYYWSDKTKDENGWIYKTRDDIYNETALSRREQETARRDGRNLGLIEEKLAGQPAKLHYRINYDRMIEIIENYLKKRDKANPKKLFKKEKLTSSISYLENLPDKDIKELSEKYKVDEQFVKDRADDVITYCKAKGKFYRDYKAALRNFIKTHNRNSQWQRAPKESDSEIKLKKLQEQKERDAEKEKDEDKPRTKKEQDEINKKLAKIRKDLQDKCVLKR